MSRVCVPLGYPQCMAMHMPVPYWMQHMTLPFVMERRVLLVLKEAEDTACEHRGRRQRCVPLEVVASGHRANSTMALHIY